jgi:dipeptidyl aminopeptidase/acylaminoacyl peptidase
VQTIAPYGSWSSPISARDLVARSHPVADARFVGDEIWWSELRPDQAGRYSIRRRDPAGAVADVLAPPWNARTRVHEYGGGAWTVTADGTLIFAEFTDQRLYRVDPANAGADPAGTGADPAGAGADPHSTPVALTPPPSVPAGTRYAELIAVDEQIWAVREQHGAAGIRRDICTIPLDGRAATDESLIRSVVAGSHFLAYPRLSPDRRRLAWIAWDHPQMPWDGTELRVAELDAKGSCAGWRTVAGGVSESVLQPEWVTPETLDVISDRSGWWNLYRHDLSSEAPPRALSARSEDIGGPLWELGSIWYQHLQNGHILAVSTLGLDRLVVLDPETGQQGDLDVAGLSNIVLADTSEGQALLLGGGARLASGLRTLDLNGRTLTEIRLSTDSLPEAAYLPEARLMTFSGPDQREVHCVVYPPSNPDHAGPAGEMPPYIATVHGGPTSHVSPSVDLAKAFFTSRGIGVIDVNYGGSTGYGREYRERLRGQWGIVDVEDTVAAVRGLAGAGLADPARLAITGGSAGGWTVLSALTGTRAFACGASYFGVAELVNFVADTHDFESRYLDGLIGALPEAAAEYVRRAPLSHVEDLRCPVLLLQGLDDPVVPPSQAELFRDALVRNSVVHAYRAYPGESHGFRRAETIIDARQSELSFYGQVLGFDPPGIPVLTLWRPDR